MKKPKLELPERLGQAEILVEQHTAIQTAEHRDNSLVLVGGINAAFNLGKALTHKAMEALEMFKAGKGHEALGFERFDDFLNESSVSPMTKSQYYSRRELLTAEGGQVFDLLNGVGVPISTRKQLPPGTVRIEDDAVIVGDNTIPLSDSRLLAQTIRALASANARQEETIKRGEDDAEKLRKRIHSLNQEMNRVSMRQGEAPTGAISPLARAKLLVAAAFTEYVKEIKGLPPEELEAQRQELCAFGDAQATRVYQAVGYADDAPDGLRDLDDLEG